MDVSDEKDLLNYETYNDYLDSFVRPDDLFYLRSTKMTRMVAALGLRSAGDVLNEKQFYQQREIVRENLFPSRKPYILFSARCNSDDGLLLELAERERANRVGLMTTLISMTHRQPNGTELSGFIDYEESLRKSILEFDEGATDWFEIFRETKRIRLSKNDLGYYNWSTGFSILNDSKNFKVIADPKRGLIFESKHDRCQFHINPLQAPGNGTTRTVVRNSSYDHVVLYDHVIRGRL